VNIADPRGARNLVIRNGADVQNAPADSFCSVAGSERGALQNDIMPAAEVVAKLLLLGLQHAPFRGALTGRVASHPFDQVGLHLECMQVLLASVGVGSRACHLCVALQPVLVLDSHVDGLAASSQHTVSTR
jgi:hypothetical protein